MITTLQGEGQSRQHCPEIDHRILGSLTSSRSHQGKVPHPHTYMCLLLKTREDEPVGPAPWSRGFPGNVSKLRRNFGKMPEECGSNVAWSVRLGLRSSCICLLSWVKQALMLHGDTGGGVREGANLWFLNSVTPCLSQRRALHSQPWGSGGFVMEGA